MNDIKLTLNTLNLDYVNNLIEKFNLKAEKLGKKQLETFYSEVYFDDTDKNDIKELVDINIKQLEEFRLGDYEVVAQIDHTYPVKNFIKSYTNITTEQENEYQHLESNCQHCNFKRKRNYTFILKNLETEEFIQVGKTCLKDFTGHDILKSLNYFDLFEELQFELLNCYKSDKKIQFYSINKILGMIHDEIKLHGYKSSKMKYEGRIDMTTGDIIKYRVKDIMSSIYENKRVIPTVNKEDESYINEVKNYILSFDYKMENESLQDFYKSLQNIIKYDYCKFNDISILATMFTTYDILKQKEKKEDNKNISNYVGSIGDKIKIEVTLRGKFSYETQYGYMCISLFVDRNGNVYKWVSKNTLNIKLGEFITIQGTIKNHEIYQGEKQTVLTRCKKVV